MAQWAVAGQMPFPCPQSKIPLTAGLQSGRLRRSVESDVIPAKAGIQFPSDMDPRLRGGDVLNFHFYGWASGP
jgi:hypothetical protein